MSHVSLTDRVVVLVGLVGFSPGHAQAAPAPADPPTFIDVFIGVPGPPEEHRLDEGAARFTASRRDGGVVLGLDKDGWTFMFLPPVNRQLAVGPYENATRQAGPTTPGLTVLRQPVACTAIGRFDVLDLALSSDGQVQRLAVDLSGSCGGQPLKGRVRFHSTPPYAAPPDDDHDGVPNTIDVCPATADASQSDRDHDGLGDACDPTSENTKVSYRINRPNADGGTISYTRFAKDAFIGGRTSSGFLDVSLTGPDISELFRLTTKAPLQPGPYDRVTNVLGSTATTILVPTLLCEATGTILVRQIVPAADGTISRASLDVTLACVDRPWTFTAQIRVRATATVPPADADGDGVADTNDSCRTIANADQADADLDAVGDACDPRFDDTFMQIDRDALGTSPAVHELLHLRDGVISASRGSSWVSVRGSRLGFNATAAFQTGDGAASAVCTSIGAGA